MNSAVRSWESVEALIVVKAIPAISQKYGEAVCVAGIRTDRATPEWLRLFPVDFRDRPKIEQFKKYEVVRFQAQTHGTDTRPESMRPNLDRAFEVVRTLGTDNAWTARRDWIEPLLVESMCEVDRRRRSGRTSLAVFRPLEVQDFTITEDSPTWDEAKANRIEQASLLVPDGTVKGKLVKVPYIFRYRYRCAESSCKGHHQAIIDWEIGEAWRTWERKYGAKQVLERLRTRWLDEMCGAERDTAFFVGNAKGHENAFMVLGVFWPPKTNQLRLGLEVLDSD